jgi:hypothetical protein
MAKLVTDLAPTRALHPREALYGGGVLAALNAEFSIACDGCGSVTLDLSGTFNLSVEVAGAVDGVTWRLIPIKPINQAAKQYAVVAGAPGAWIAPCAGYRQVRVRVTAYTSGAANATLVANLGLPDQSLDGMVTPLVVTAVGAAGAAVTLTLPAPAAGLRHYLTNLLINRFAAAALTAAAVPVTVTTTNLPGSLAFSFAADAALQGTLDRWREDFAYPVAASALATATTIVCPATTGVIWRATAGYYLAP